MFCWQITKYDPKNRDADRVYLKDEWTDYSCIGKSFEGKELTYEDYLKVEDAYIQAVLLFMKCLDLDSLKVISLEKNGKNPNSVTLEGIKIKNNTFYPKEKIVFIIRSILRFKFWCMLETENMRVKFGYDYYMMIGCTMPCATTIAQIEGIGLFVEPRGREFLFDEEDDE